MSDQLHVVALSGGKDSTAMALKLLEVEPRDYTYICTPTGNELPEMWAHWRHLGELLGKPILPVIGGTLEDIIHEQRMIPNFRARFCTRMLKIEPFAAWLMSLSSPATIYVGIRADEAEREAGDYTNVPDVTRRFPLREWGWGIEKVRSYLAERNIAIPARSDCAWCFFQTLGEWWNLWRDHAQLYLDAEAIEAEFGHTFRSPERDTWPSALKDLRARFERGDVPRGADLQRDLFKQMQCRVCRA
jgi:3'-phosphoadenosine 5'-phosphosulfate sulfotransferase (PAPS reductase)/FAD synthetase